VPADGPPTPARSIEDAFLWGPCQCKQWSAEAMPALARQIEDLATEEGGGRWRVYRAMR
jgi:hypothetical protein